MEKVDLENVYDYVGDVSCRLGNLIRKTRMKKGITLRGLARKSGVCIASISDIENANKLPRMLLVLRLAAALDIPFEYILGSEII